MLRIARMTGVLILSGLMLGCATPRYNYMPESIEISEPPLGSTNVVYVGDSMLRQGNYVERDALYLLSPVKIGGAYTLSEGYYIKKGEDKKTEFYMPSVGTNGGQIHKAALADPWKCVQAYKNEQKLCVVTFLNVHTCTKKAVFERRKTPGLESGSFQQTLIYSGRIGDKINIGYREFSDSLARPAFNNDVEYDLSQSSIIGYKGARIEVIRATNECIEYRVIRNFNQARF